MIVHDCRRKIGSQESITPPVSTKANSTPPVDTNESSTRTIKEFNRIINASWHHDQVLEATIAKEEENSNNIPDDQLFNLKSQELKDLFTKLGLVIKFQKRVRIDSLHKSSVSVLAHTDNVFRGEKYDITYPFGRR